MQKNCRSAIVVKIFHTNVAEFKLDNVEKVGKNIA